jgi:acyl-CoA reductase-like NAD-dependent aldehyde dehydrogenase
MQTSDQAIAGAVEAAPEAIKAAREEIDRRWPTLSPEERAYAVGYVAGRAAEHERILSHVPTNHKVGVFNEETGEIEWRGWGH